MARKTRTLKRQTFRLTDPAAQEVLLAGDFTDWQNRAIQMEDDGEGHWSVTVELSPGTHGYLFIVDGKWREDPECTARVANPYGGQNMVRRVL